MSPLEKARAAEIEAKIAKQKKFKLGKIGEDGILGPKKTEQPKKREKKEREEVVFSSLDEDYTYHDKEDY